MNIENLKNEVWMTHPKYVDYAASNYGRIKHLERDVMRKNGKPYHCQEQLTHPSPNRDGYLRFAICENGKRIAQPYVHRFVWEAFYQEPIPSDLRNFQINHIDENKQNNSIENLELCSAQYNIGYSQAKAVGQYTLEGKLIKIWKSTMEAEREGGFQHSAVSECCNNKFHREGNNVYKNFIWKYIE